MRSYRLWLLCIPQCRQCRCCAALDWFCSSRTSCISSSRIRSVSCCCCSTESPDEEIEACSSCSTNTPAENHYQALHVENGIDSSAPLTAQCSAGQTELNALRALNDEDEDDEDECLSGSYSPQYLKIKRNNEQRN